ncbi:MAG: Uma2 family endonuclease [Anaerolineae bacterium]|nr:Uma2 family endonuclease [Anaerolineae bacterium]
MVTKPAILTVEEFDRIAMLPENRDRLLEYIGGEIVEVVSNTKSSRLGARIVGRIEIFVTDHDLGFVTGADGGYMVSGERYIPDAAFTGKDRQVVPSADGYYPVAPDLAVEVLSPGNSVDEIATKVANYLAAGTTVWIVDGDKREVRILAPRKSAVVLRMSDVLDGGEALSGFKLKVSDLFAGME